MAAPPSSPAGASPTQLGVANPQFAETAPQADETARRPAEKRSPFPRFNLRTLFVLAVLFCLFFAWVGRGFYRVRQEDAAIETILRGGGSIYAKAAADPTVPWEPLPDPNAAPWRTRLANTVNRAIGWSERPPLEAVGLKLADAEDPRAGPALAALPVFPEIEFVALEGEAFDDRAIEPLGRLPDLEKLYLVNARLTGAGLAKIAAPERIETLVIDEHAAEGNVLSGVVVFTELRDLQVALMPVTKAEVEAIASLPKLQKLDLMQVEPIEPGVLAPLEGHAGLRTLFVRSAAYDAADLKAIASLPRLESLFIQGLTDADLPTIGTAPTLKKIGLFANVTRDGAQRFSLDHPDWTVIMCGAYRWEYLQGGKSIPDPSRRVTLP